MQHAGDLRLLEPIVKALHREVDWILMGMCPDFIRPYAKEVHPFVGVAEYPRQMGKLALDLALAPLEMHPFNESKSNLRLLEYGALGWPVVCTDIYPYKTDDPPVLRLPNNPQAWVDAIRERIADREALRSEGVRLKDWVFANCMLEDRLEVWLKALTDRS
jgi:glycosyltransferase involved in cell wall biosynthesis